MPDSSDASEPGQPAAGSDSVESDHPPNSAPSSATDDVPSRLTPTDSTTTAAGPTDSPSTTPSAETRRETGIFDRFMDAILNRRPNSVTTPPPRDPPPPPPATDSGDANLFSDFYGGSAIMITVNYVFSDENDPTNPNSTGSLVISLPNNAQNRDLSTIQEFVRLATQMAYSTISGMHKKRGITLDRFNSFPIKKASEADHTCSICLEEFENLPTPSPAVADDMTPDDGPVKKRKLNDSSATPTPTPPPAPAPASAQDSSQRPGSRVKYLHDFSGEFVHAPVQLPCKHVFGKSCLFEWLKNHTSCPLCRLSCSDEPENRNTSNTTTIDLTSPSINTSGTQGTSRNVLLDVLGSRLDRQRSEATRPAYVTQIPLRRVLRSGNGVQEDSNSTARATNRVPYYHIIDPSRYRDFLNSPPTSTRDGSQSDPLLPSYVASRRTENGVETISSEQPQENVLDYLHLRSLLDDDQNSTPTNTDSNSNSTSNSNSNSNEVNDNDSNNTEA